MKIILAGGGTAGHINPALAIANYLVKKDKNTSILFIGTKKGMESDLIPKAGYDIKFVEVEGLSKKLNLKNIKSLCHMLTAKRKCKSIIKKFGADIVIGTGGYVCAPAVMAANSMGVPTIIHEQNVFPGSAIKLLSKKSSVTAISFDDSRKYLANAKNIVFTGNPIREEILNSDRASARRSLGLGSEKLVVIFGGSLGAEKINSVSLEYIKTVKENEDIRIIFATGAKNYDKVMSMAGKLPDNIIIKPYIHNMAQVMSAADLLVCRSGAITVSEISALGKAAILVPSPNVTHNHQEYNARVLSDKGGAITILEKDFNIDSLKKAVYSILGADKAKDEMSRIAISLSSVNALDIIYDEVKKLCR